MADQPCADCAHFCTDPRVIERSMRGLAVMASAHAAVRGRDGLCLAHDRLTNGMRSCAMHTRKMLQPVDASL